METKQASIAVPALIGGIIAGIICVIYSSIIYATLGVAHQELRYVSYIILAAVIFVATKQFRDKKSEGHIAYARALGFGTLLSLFSSIIVAVYTYVYMSFINTHMIDQIMEQAQIKMANRPDMTPQAMEMGLKVMKIMSSPAVISVFAILGTVFFGFIISLIVAAILQKEKPVFETPDTQA